MVIVSHWFCWEYRETTTLSLNWILWLRVESSLRNWRHFWRPIRSTSHCPKWAGTLCLQKRKRRNAVRKNWNKYYYIFSSFLPSFSRNQFLSRVLMVTYHFLLHRYVIPVFSFYDSSLGKLMLWRLVYDLVKGDDDPRIATAVKSLPWWGRRFLKANLRVRLECVRMRFSWRKCLISSIKTEMVVFRSR